MIVCADDFGLRPDIDEAILELCARRKLSAVSCMTVLDRCQPDGLTRLRNIEHPPDVGLHLCLSSEPAAGHIPGSSRLVFPSFGSCLRAGQLGTVRKDRVLCEIRAQYDLFLKKAGYAPTHIDGHLHIHQAPVVRRALIEFISDVSKSQYLCVRNTAQSMRTLWKNRLPMLKALAVGFLGARMHRDLRANGIRTNCGFSGIYDFRHYRRFPDYFPRFMRALPDPSGILVVHPGKTEPWRFEEFQTLLAS